MSVSQSDVLVIGMVLPSAEARLAERFALLRISSFDDLERLDPVRRSTLQGLVTFGHVKVDAALLDRLPGLKIVGNFGVGYDSVEAKACAARGIIVTNTPDVLTDETADTAVALLLMTVREYAAAERHLRAGNWSASAYPLTPTTLRGRQVGIAGLGRIGKAVARRLEGFSVQIAYCGRRAQTGISYRYFPSVLAMAQEVDTLISVLPGSPDTDGLIDRAVFKALGPAGVFINIGRGSVVNEADLLDALQTKTIAAAGLDVFQNEPNIDPAFFGAPNTVLLPHVGSASQHTRAQMGRLLTDNVERFFTDGHVYTPVAECAAIAKIAVRPQS